MIDTLVAVLAWTVTAFVVATPLCRMFAVTADVSDELRSDQTDWQGTVAVSENVIHGEGL